MRTLLAPVSLALALALAGPALAGRLDDRGFNQLKRQLRAQAAQQDLDGLARTIAEVGADDSARAVDLLLKTALALPQGKVFAATSAALAQMTSNEATFALIEVVEKKSGHPGAKILCIDALAGRGDPASGAALGAALSAKQPEVLRAAVTAIRKRKAHEAVPALIDLWERLQRQPEGLLSNEVNDTLWVLTGKSFETAADWRKFWDTARDRPMTGGGGEGTGERPKKPRPTFFGSEIPSNRLVFVIDISGSMDGDRIAKCKEQLKQCIDALERGSAFTIVAYSSSVRVWKDRLQGVTPAVKDEAKGFVDGLQVSGATHTLAGLKSGFEIEGADALILLSDGAPTDSTPEQILDEVRGINGFKRWRVDTFGFGTAGYGNQFAEFLKDLAEQHGGKFTPLG